MSSHAEHRAIEEADMMESARDEMQRERDRLLAENQRLREALERISKWDWSEGAEHNPYAIAREALAGDAE